MSLGITIGIVFAVYLFVTVPRKKYEAKFLKTSRKLNGIINKIDSYENQEDIDRDIILELEALKESDFGIREAAEEKIDILMSKIRE